MKAIFAFLIVLAITPAIAQTYTMSDDSISVTEPYTYLADNWTTLAVIGQLTNNTADSVQSEWVRNIIYLTPGWHSTVCDPVECADDATDSANFIFNPNLVGNIYVDFVPNLLSGTGVVHVNFHRQNDVSDFAEATFIGTIEESTGTSSIEKLKDIKLFPNPSKEKLMVISTPSMTPALIEVYDVLGKKMNSKIIKEGTQLFSVDIFELKSGFYFLRMKLSNGTIVTRQFTKN